MSRPGTCARLAVFAAGAYQLQVCGVYRVNGLIRTAERWPGRVAFKFNSDPSLNNTSLAAWSVAAFGDQSEDGNVAWGTRLGCYLPREMATVVSPIGPRASLDEQ